MAWKSAALTVCGNLIPDFYRPPSGVLFPFGHIVSDAAPPHVRHLYAVPSIAKFKADLDFLCRQFRPLRLAELEPLQHGGDSKTIARSFILSFDDGMREVYDVIAPILRERGLPAIFFLNSATIDNKRLMWRHKISLLIERSKQQPRHIPPRLSGRPSISLQAKLNALRFADESLVNEVAKFYELDFDDYLRSTRPYLTSEQVLALAREGFEFGGHSESHPYFHEIALEEQEKQISGSVRFIRSLGLSCRYFAFPFHDNGAPVSIFRYMTDLDIALSFGTSEARVDSIPFSFQRFALDGENAKASFRDILRRLSAKSLARRLSNTEVIRRD